MQARPRVTRNGETLGFFIPAQKRNRKAKVEAMRAAAKELDAMIAAWGASGDELMREYKEICTVTSKPKRGSDSAQAIRRTGRFWQRPLLSTVRSGQKTRISSDVASPLGPPQALTSSSLSSTRFARWRWPSSLTIFVSSFVSRSVQSHMFSTVLSNLAESSKVLKMAQKREK